MMLIKPGREWLTYSRINCAGRENARITSGGGPFSIMFICISNQKLIDRKGLHLLGIEEGTEELEGKGDSS